MKIAQIAPLYEAVPPRLYGGTERVVSNLTEELVRQGHDVTLFASEDSFTSAELVPCISRAIRLDPEVRDPVPHMMVMLDKVQERAAEFDILHFHIDYFQFPMFRRSTVPILTTLHGRQDLSDHLPLYSRFPGIPLVSISHAQRLPLPGANFAGTVYHGLPLDVLNPSASQGGGYLAFLGRMSPEKRPDRAIEIARRSGMKLKLAAKVDEADAAYFQSVVAPLIDGYQIEFIGEINESNKSDFLGRAAGLLFPIDWPEPFGLVMIEAMACATPVLAFRCGSVPEIIDHGVTGLIVGSVDEAVLAVPQLLAIDRAKVRAHFEQRFSAEQMAREYVAIYERLCRRIPSPVLVEEPGLGPETNLLE
jgi:glycosyltransferase involved in cell wall biosynthesis